MWRTNIVSLAVLFIAFLDPSIAQKTEAVVEVVEGAPLTLECALGVEQRPAWRVDGGAVAGDLRAGERAAGGGGAALTALLTAARARAAHAGLYTCGPRAAPVRLRVLPAPPAAPAAGESPAPEAAQPASAAGPAGGEGAAGGEAAVDEDLVRTLVSFKLFEPFVFNCTNPPVAAAGSRYEWYRNGTLVTAANSPKGLTLEKGGFALALRRAHEDDWGNYTCRMDGAVAGAYEAEALTLPRVPPNTNVVEGQKFSITCKLIGKPPKPVSWWFHGEGAAENGTELVAGGRVALRASAAGVAGAVLEVGEAARADAGEYRCRAGGPGAPREAASVLRVKDVYAALWPFLGICLEVFVLCAIILVYEKRRTKPELDDSDADGHDQ